MLILTQNKEEIINLDEISNIYIVDNNIWVNNGGVEPISNIGNYETKDRCKEILKNILRRYRACNGDKYIRNEIFEMPTK